MKRDDTSSKSSTGKKPSKRASKDFFLSVIAVLSNDADILGGFLKETVGVLRANYMNFELVLVDDGSTDRTPAIVEEFIKKNDCVRYLRLSRRFGNEIAISAGLDTVIGDVIVILDIEKDPVRMIPKMVDTVKSTNSIVYGINTEINRVLPLYYKVGKWFYHRFIRVFLHFYPPEHASYFIGLSRQHLNAIIQIKARSKFLRIFSSQIGFKRVELPYKMQLRRKKPRSRPISESVKYAVDAIIVNSLAPLKLASWLCFLAAAVNLVYIVYILLVKLLDPTVAAGWAATSLQLSTMFVVIFMTLAINSQYVARMIDDAKDRPLYYISEEKNSSVMIAFEGSRRNVKHDE